MIESRSVDFAKEVDDLAVLFPTLITAILAKKAQGKSVVQIATELATEDFQLFVAAVAGVGDISTEVAASRKAVLATLGYRLGETADAILGK